MTVSAVRPCRMALQRERRLPSGVVGPVHIAVPVQSKVGICRRKAESRSFFDARAEIFEKAVERSIAVGAR